MTAVELKEYVYENQKIPFVLEDIGCKNIVYHQNKDYYSCTNAIGGDCNNPAAINIRNNKYLNYINYTRGVSADDNEDLISLIQYNKSCSFLQAIKYLHKLFGFEYSYDKSRVEKEMQSPLDIFKKYSGHHKRYIQGMNHFAVDENLYPDMIPYIHISWFYEGIMPWTVKKFGLGYSYYWKRIVIPHRYWLDGRLMGYNARTTVEHYKEFGIKKYYLTPGMNKSINLYGLYEHYNDIIKAGYVVVYEGEKSVLKRDSLLDCTGVALSGHNISEEQVRILIGLNVDIIISMDKDIQIEEIWDICEHFYGIRNVFYTFDKYGLLKEKDSIADQKNKIVKWFIKNKVVYDEEKHNEYLKGLNDK